MRSYGVIVNAGNTGESTAFTRRGDDFLG